MATSIAGAVATVLVTKIPGFSGRYYYRYINENEALYGTLVNILHAFKDNKHVHSICKTFENVEIAADMMCFRNITDDWGWSDNARMKVRIQYNQMNRTIVVMCKKQYQLTSFLNKFCKEDFNPIGELTLNDIS